MWELWGAARVMQEYCSDDGFHYFRDWLISKGRIVFETAIQDPESLATLDFTNKPRYYDFELFGYVVLEVYESKTQSEMPLSTLYIGGPCGEKIEEEDLQKRFPILFAAVNGKYVLH